jgi:predicted ATPase
MAYPQRGEVLSSRYRIEELLGEGSFGRVYRAVDERTTGEVAVKVLKAGPDTSATHVRRFEREIATLRKLDHPVILQYLDHGRHADTLYLVVELLRGRRLTDAAADFHGQAERVLLLGSRLARAFAAAHERGVIHRDIKPDNIHLTETGEPRILDYGLARWERADSSQPGTMVTLEKLTQTNALMGTIPYMAPEQIRAEPVGFASDIFSLGVVLYELVAGRRPYVAETLPDLLAAIEAGEPPELEDLVPSLDAPVGSALSAVLRRAVHPLAPERFHGMEEFAEALEKALDLGASIPADATTAILIPPRATILERSLCTLVGRERELVELARLLEAAREGRSVSVVVEGPAGIGKSVLVNEAVRRAHRAGSLCLTAAPGPAGGLPGEHPCLAWLGRAAEVFPRDESVRLALAAFREPAGDGGQPAADAAGRAVALRSAITSLARRMPVVLLLEDLHRASPDLVQLVHALRGGLGAERAMLVLTRRSDAVPEPASVEPLDELLRAPQLGRIALGPLDAEPLRRLVEELYPGVEIPARLFDELVERSGGNPSYARAILKLLEDRGTLTREGADWRLGELASFPHPPEARSVLEERLAGLGPEDLAVLEVAAVLGQEFEIDRVAEVLDRPPDEVVPILRGLDARRQLVLREQQGYRFDQPVTREILLQRLAPERKAELNLRAATTLAARVGDDAQPRLTGAVATHLAEAGRLAEAIPFLVRTGRALAARNVPREAVPWLERARAAIEQNMERRDEVSRTELRVLLADVLLLLGDSLRAVARHDEALERLEAARALANVAKREDLRARSLIGMARVYLARGDLLQAQRRARDAERTSRRHALDGELAMALSVAANAMSRAGEAEDAEQMWQEAAGLLEAAGRRAEAAEVHFRLGNHYFRLGRYDRADQCYRAAEERVVLEEHPPILAQVQNGRAGVQLALGKPDVALPMFEEVAALRRKLGDRRGEAATLHNIANCHHRLGDYEEAVRIYRQAIEMRQEIGDVAGRASSQRNHAATLFDLGRIEEALAEATEALNVKRQREDLGYVPQCLNLVGEIELRVGRTERAREAFSEVLSEVPVSGDEVFKALAGLAEADWLSQQGDAVSQGVEEVARKLGQSSQPIHDLKAGCRLLQFLRAAGAGEERWRPVAERAFGERDRELFPEEGLYFALGRAIVAALEGRDREAERGFLVALETAEKLGVIEECWRIHRERARLLPEGSEAHLAELRAARRIVDAQAGRFRQPELRRSYLAQREVAELLAGTPKKPTD